MNFNRDIAIVPAFKAGEPRRTRIGSGSSAAHQQESAHARNRVYVRRSGEGGRRDSPWSEERIHADNHVAQRIIERHSVAVAAADPQLLVADYTIDVKRFMPNKLPFRAT
jgi:hypothetical protein